MSKTRPIKSRPEAIDAAAARVVARNDVRADVPRLALGERNAAASLDLPRSTFRDVVAKYGIPYVEVGNGTVKRRRLYLVEDLQAWLRSHRNGGAA